MKENRVNLPAAILQAGDGSYFVVTVSHVNKHFVDVYLRKSGEGLAIVGLERK